MQVFTYFKDIPGLGSAPHEQLAFWQEQWASKGFEPVVLNEEHAAKNSFYPEFLKGIDNLKTTNPIEYEKACFLRHLAMTQFGGLMTDIDVYNLTLKPEDIPDVEGPLILEDHRVPCAVYGSKAGYSFLSRALLAGIPYCTYGVQSDMGVMEYLHTPVICLCYQYPNMTNKLVHCSSSAVGRDISTIRKIIEDYNRRVSA